MPEQQYGTITPAGNPTLPETITPHDRHETVVFVCAQKCPEKQECPEKPPLSCYAADRAQDTDTITWVILCMGGFVIFLVVLSFIQFAVDDSEHAHHSHQLVWH